MLEWRPRTVRVGAHVEGRFHNGRAMLRLQPVHASYLRNEYMWVARAKVECRVLEHESFQPSQDSDGLVEHLILSERVQHEDDTHLMVGSHLLCWRGFEVVCRAENVFGLLVRVFNLTRQ